MQEPLNLRRGDSSLNKLLACNSCFMCNKFGSPKKGANPAEQQLR